VSIFSSDYCSPTPRPGSNTVTAIRCCIMQPQQSDAAPCSHMYERGSVHRSLCSQSMLTIHTGIHPPRGQNPQIAIARDTGRLVLPIPDFGSVRIFSLKRYPDRWISLTSSARSQIYRDHRWAAQNECHGVSADSLQIQLEWCLSSQEISPSSGHRIYPTRALSVVIFTNEQPQGAQPLSLDRADVAIEQSLRYVRAKSQKRGGEAPIPRRRAV